MTIGSVAHPLPMEQPLSCPDAGRVAVLLRPSLGQGKTPRTTFAYSVILKPAFELARLDPALARPTAEHHAREFSQPFSQRIIGFVYLPPLFRTKPEKRFLNHWRVSHSHRTYLPGEERTING